MEYTITGDSLLYYILTLKNCCKIFFYIFIFYIHVLYLYVFQLIITLYLLNKQIGVSFLAGITFAIVLIPINKIIANHIGKFSTKLMEYKDQRVRLIGEILRGITTIKLNVWEDHFLRNISS